MKTHARISASTSVLALMAFSFTLAGGAAAKPAPGPDRVVFPTGQWPTDVRNVQAAADLGGTVLLKATNVAGVATVFNFGNPDPEVDDVTGFTLFLRTDVRLLGEAVGVARTTILGGFHTITVGLTMDYEYAPTPGHTRIENIHFEGAKQFAIYVIQAAGLEIVHNRISNVVGVFNLGIPIVINAGGSKGRMSEKVVISDNVIEDIGADGQERSEAIIIGDVAVDMDITGNSIVTTQFYAAIEIVRQVEGTVRIENNFVAPNPEAPGSGLGIYIFENDLWDVIRTSSPVYHVVGNRILVKNGDSGIGFVRPEGSSIDGPIIERNHITVHGSLAGITFGGNVSNARVSSNRIDGDGAVGLEVFTYEPGQVAESNTFVGNDMTQFTAGIADLYLDSHTRNTVARGHFEAVIDLGTGNRITNVSRR